MLSLCPAWTGGVEMGKSSDVLVASLTVPRGWSSTVSLTLGAQALTLVKDPGSESRGPEKTECVESGDTKSSTPGC